MCASCVLPLIYMCIHTIVLLRSLFTAMITEATTDYKLWLLSSSVTTGQPLIIFSWSFFFLSRINLYIFFYLTPSISFLTKIPSPKWTKTIPKERRAEVTNYRHWWYHLLNYQKYIVIYSKIEKREETLEVNNYIYTNIFFLFKLHTLNISY